MESTSNSSFFSVIRPLTVLHPCTSDYFLPIKTALLSTGPALHREPSRFFSLFLWQSHWKTCLLLFWTCLFWRCQSPLCLVLGHRCSLVAGLTPCRGSPSHLSSLIRSSFGPLRGPLFLQVDLNPCPGSLLRPEIEQSRAPCVHRCFYCPPCGCTAAGKLPSPSGHSLRMRLWDIGSKGIWSQGPRWLAVQLTPQGQP